MAICAQFGTSDGNSVNAALTRYMPIGEGRFDIFSATEAGVQVTHRTVGTYRRLYVRISANSTTATSTIRTRINAGDGAQSVSVGSGATGDFEDNVNIDTVAAGDELNYQIVAGATGTSITVRVIVIVFDTGTSSTVKRFHTAPNSAYGASVTYYHGIGARSIGTLTETDVQFEVKVAGTLQNLFVNITVNTRSDTTTVRSRKNTADGNLSVSIGAAATGFFEDTSNSDTLAINDLINSQHVTGGGTGALTIIVIGVEYSTTRQFHFITTGQVDDSASVTSYRYVGGGLNTNGTEALRQHRIRIDAVLSNYFAYVRANGVSASSTYTMRVDGVASALTFSVGAGATGQFEDTTHTVAVTATSKINDQIVVGAGGTTISTTLIGLLVTLKSLPQSLQVNQAVNRAATF